MVSALEEEVEAWYKTLPDMIRFTTDFDTETFPREKPFAPLLENNVAWLRSSYLSCPGIFHWPAVQEAAQSTSDTPITPAHQYSVQKLLGAVMGYISSASQYMDRQFNPLVFTQAQGQEHV